jgi:hypothetical protein
MVIASLLIEKQNGVVNGIYIFNCQLRDYLLRERCLFSADKLSLECIPGGVFAPKLTNSVIMSMSRILDLSNPDVFHTYCAESNWLGSQELTQAQSLKANCLGQS